MKFGSVIVLVLAINRVVGGTKLYDASTKYIPVSNLTSALFQNESVTEIISLRLNLCEINDVDKNTFTNMTNLTYLEMTKNNFVNLKVGTFQYNTKLKTINLCCNEIEKLKNGIFANLVSTTKLDLHKNDITSIEADVFKDMESLQDLYIWGNRLSMLHADIFSRNAKLDTLHISFNSIRDLNKNMFQNTTQLKLLAMQGNRITSMDRDLFSSLFILEVLSISYNIIRDIEIGTFRNNKNLRTLYLTGNHLSHINDNLLTNLTKLVFINMGDNYISSIGMHALPNTTTLKELHIHENRLQYVNSTLLDLFKQLTGFSLYDNPWYCDCRLEQLHDIWKNHTEFYDPQCAGPAKLHNLTWDKITSDDLCSQPASEEPITENEHSAVENKNDIHNNCNLSSDEQINNNISVSIGRNVIITCKICARKVQWLYRNNVIHGNSISGSGLQYVVYMERENNTVTSRLMIIDARIEDGGTYTCRALNSLEEKNYTLKLYQAEKDIENIWTIFGPLSFAILLLMLFIVVILLVVKKYRSRHSPGLCDMSLKRF